MSTLRSTANMEVNKRRLWQRAFKVGNRFMVLLWRLGLGWLLNIAPRYAGQIMVLTHTGRKSGRKYQTPVNFALVDSDLYCTVGFGHISDWYRNIIAQPEIEVWLPNGRWNATATEVTEPSTRLPLLREVLIGSAFAARLAGINPHTMPDHELAQVTEGYRILLIRRENRVHTMGDLIWVWPLILSGALWWRRRNH